ESFLNMPASELIAALQSEELGEDQIIARSALVDNLQKAEKRYFPSELDFVFDSLEIEYEPLDLPFGWDFDTYKQTIQVKERYAKALDKYLESLNMVGKKSSKELFELFGYDTPSIIKSLQTIASRLGVERMRLQEMIDNERTPNIINRYSSAYTKDL